MMSMGAVDSLDDLATKVDQAFASHRQSDEFKTISSIPVLLSVQR